MQPVFSIQAVQKSYAGRKVVDIQHLDVYGGEILAVVGPSGAGKSTLLRLLNFLEYPDGGGLTYAGVTVTPVLPLALRRQVTMVFQRPLLLNASVSTNVAYGLRLRGQHGDHERVLDLLQRMGLEKLKRAPARSLSGGEMQRVALARALVVDPKVLLLDEPTANLDPYNIGLIEEVVRQTNINHGTTVILVTHNVFQARRLAGRVALILNGQIIETADTRTFFENPADKRTSAFVKGEMIY